MGLSQPRDHRISLSEAGLLTRNYRNLYATETSALVTGVYSREAFEAILAQPGVQGVRFYGGSNADGTATLILVGRPVCSSANPPNRDRRGERTISVATF